MRMLALLYFVVVIVLLLLYPLAHAQHKHGDEVITGATGKFYETWMRPDMPTVSCCNRLDCAAVSGVRVVGGHYEAQRKSDGQWLRIPADKIEHNRDSPDGQSHMCSMGATVYCFLAAGGT